MELASPDVFRAAFGGQRARAPEHEIGGGSTVMYRVATEWLSKLEYSDLSKDEVREVLDKADHIIARVRRLAEQKAQQLKLKSELQLQQRQDQRIELAIDTAVAIATAPWKKRKIGHQVACKSVPMPSKAPWRS